MNVEATIKAIRVQVVEEPFEVGAPPVEREPREPPGTVLEPVRVASLKTGEVAQTNIFRCRVTFSSGIETSSDIVQEVEVPFSTNSEGVALPQTVPVIGDIPLKIVLDQTLRLDIAVSCFNPLISGSIREIFFWMRMISSATFKARE